MKIITCQIFSYLKPNTIDIRYSHGNICLVNLEKDGELQKSEEAKERVLASPCDRSWPRLYKKEKKNRIQYEGGSLSSDHHFNQAKYVPLDKHLLPDMSFSAIVRFMVDRCIGQNQPTQNSIGLDRASKHNEAGDVRDIEGPRAMISHFVF